MYNMSNMHNMSEIQNMSNMQSTQNIQNIQNMLNMLNMLNMQNVHKNADLVHKIVYLALGVAKIGSSSSPVSSARAVLGVVLSPAAAAGEGTDGAKGAEVVERPPCCFFLAVSMRWGKTNIFPFSDYFVFRLFFLGLRV
jgi:hypothetical protein